MTSEAGMHKITHIGLTANALKAVEQQEKDNAEQDGHHARWQINTEHVMAGDTVYDDSGAVQHR